MGSISNGPSTADLVAERFENAQTYANTAYARAREFIAEIAGLATEEPPDFGLDDIVVDVEAEDIDGVFPPPPDPLTVEMETFTPPSDPVVNEVSLDDIEPAPGFDVETISIDLPERPATPNVPDLGDAPDVADISVPNAPTLDTVTVPTLRDITIPTAPEFEEIAFEGIMPVEDLDLPTTPFSFTETPYVSDLLTNTKEKLNDLVVNGGTGLGADIEEAIWDREAERAELALAERKDAASAEWAERGFDLPNGVLTSLLHALDVEYEHQRLQSGREIAIKQAEIAKEETQFALKQSSDLEQILMNYASQVAQRQLEAAKAVVEYGIAIFNARVAKYNAQIEAYKAQATVYESRIRGMLARVEVFRAQIEAQKLIGELNSLDVELYGKMLQATQIRVEMYKTEMEAAQVRAGIEKLRIEAFRSRVDAYTAVVQLHVSLFNMYEAGIRGELAKAQIYQSQVEAYKARVDASKTNASVIMEKARVEGEVEKLKVEIYASRIEAYKAQIQAEVARVTGLVDVYKGQVEAFKAQNEGEAARIDALVKEFTAKIQQNVEVAKANVEVAKTKLAAWSSLQELRAELLKTGGALLAQIAASSLAGVQASAQLGASAQYSEENRSSVSSSIETRYNYNYDL